jgi:hypothetical protein
MTIYRESFAIYIDTPDPAALWTGHGYLLLPADGILPEPTAFVGAGSIISLPDVEDVINGKAQRLEFVVSGVSNETLALAASDAEDVPGAAFNVARVEFNEDWSVAAVTWELEAECQKLSISSEPGEDGRVRSVTLTVGIGEVTRTRAPASYFTDADQQRKYPGDTVFSGVAKMTVGTSRRWGPAGAK